MQSEGCFCSPETQSGVNFHLEPLVRLSFGDTDTHYEPSLQAVGNLKLQPTAPANLPGDDYACAILDVWTHSLGRPQLQPPSDCRCQGAPTLNHPAKPVHRWASHHSPTGRGGCCVSGPLCLRRFVCRNRQPKRTLQHSSERSLLIDRPASSVT